VRSQQRHCQRGQPGVRWVKSTTAASHPASATRSHCTPKQAGGLSPTPQKSCGLAGLGLLGAVRDLGRATGSSCPGYVTGVGLLQFPQRAKPQLCCEFANLLSRDHRGWVHARKGACSGQEGINRILNTRWLSLC